MHSSASLYDLAVWEHVVVDGNKEGEGDLELKEDTNDGKEEERPQCNLDKQLYRLLIPSWRTKQYIACYKLCATFTSARHDAQW